MRKKVASIHIETQENKNKNSHKEAQKDTKRRKPEIDPGKGNRLVPGCAWRRPFAGVGALFQSAKASWRTWMAILHFVVGLIQEPDKA